MTDQPDPAWLRILLQAHKSGGALFSGSSGGKATFTKAELGGHLSGATSVDEAVFRLRYLGQHGEVDRIFDALLKKADRLMDTPDFAAVHCGDCVSRLAALVVAEETLPIRDQTDSYRARFMGITRGKWRHRYDKPHARLKAQLDIWAGNAVGAIRRNLYRISEVAPEK